MPGHELGDFFIWMVSLLCLKLFIELEGITHSHTPQSQQTNKKTCQTKKETKEERKSRKIKGQKQPSSLLSFNSFCSSQALSFTIR